jgi:hypothetical protein
MIDVILKAIKAEFVALSDEGRLTAADLADRPDLYHYDVANWVDCATDGDLQSAAERVGLVALAMTRRREKKDGKG